MKSFFSLTQIGLLFVLLVPLGLSCGGSSSGGGGGDECDVDADCDTGEECTDGECVDEDTPSTSQCETTCEHVYDECGFALADSDGNALSQAECEETCPDQTTTLIDCLEDVSCTEAAINACLAGTDDEDECDDDSDCDTGEECTDGTCVEEDDDVNLCGGEVCASGCCPSGVVCCGGAFCGGDCIGTPCCD